MSDFGIMLFCHVLLCSLSSSLSQPPNKHRGCKKKKVLKPAQSFLFQHMFRFCWANISPSCPCLPHRPRNNCWLSHCQGPWRGSGWKGSCSILGLNLHPEDYERDKTSHVVSEDRGHYVIEWPASPFGFIFFLNKMMENSKEELNGFKVLLFWRHDPLVEIYLHSDWLGHSWGCSDTDSWYNGITRFIYIVIDRGTLGVVVILIAGTTVLQDINSSLRVNRLRIKRWKYSRFSPRRCNSSCIL